MILHELYSKNLPETEKELSKLYEKIRKTAFNGERGSRDYWMKSDILKSIEVKMSWLQTRRMYKNSINMFIIALIGIISSIISLFITIYLNLLK